MRVTVLRNGTRVPNRLRNCEIPCGMGLLVRNQALPLRNAFRNCEMDAPVLRSGTHVPKMVSQLPNPEWSFPCEMEDFMLWWFAVAFAAAK